MYGYAWKNLGVCYYNGEGTSKNYTQAFECFKKATEVDPMLQDAWNLLGHCYNYGRGTRTNSQKAFECYNKAKELGM